MGRTYYRAASGSFAAANGTGLFFSIKGVSGKTVTVKRVSIESPTLTSPGYVTIMAARYSTAATGGTSTTLTNVRLNSSEDAGSAVLKVYTAAPTAGTKVGDISSHRVFSHKGTPAADGIYTNIEVFGAAEDEHYFVLADDTEELGLYFESAPGGVCTLALRVEWSEE